MSCRGIKVDSYHLVVEFPLSLRERCGLYVCRCWEGCSQQLPEFGVLLMVLFFLAFCSLPLWLTVLDRYFCPISPMLALEDLSIGDMAVDQRVYGQNNTVPMPTGSPWQVKSRFNVTLSAWNNNTGTGCFCTYRDMVVHVGYPDALILKREVPFWFGMKPRRSRPVVVEVKDDHFPVEKELGQFLKAELRNASSVNLQFYFGTLVMRFGMRLEPHRMACDVVAKTPLNSSQAGGNLLWKRCGPS